MTPQPSRRLFLKRLSLLSSIAVSGLSGSALARAATLTPPRRPRGVPANDSSVAGKRPNILVILGDDIGYSDIGAFGGEVETPNIDALAKRSIQFANFYNMSRCCPSRASLLTGRYPHRVNMAGNGTSLSRDVPTIAESGYPGFEASSWFGLLAPAGTPPAVVAKLNAEGNRWLATPEAKEKLLAQGAIAAGGSPADFAAHITAETAKWAKVVKESGAKVD